MPDRTDKARQPRFASLHSEDACVRVSRDRNGIFRFDYSRCSEISLRQVKAAHAEHRRLDATRRSPVLLVGGHVGHVDYRAQRFASDPSVCAVTAAVALVVNSFLERHLAKLFLIYHRPPYPVQVFSSERVAVEWLRSYSPEPEEARA